MHLAKDSAHTRLRRPPQAAVSAVAGAVLLVTTAAFAAWASVPGGPAFGAAIHGLAVPAGVAAGVLLLGEQAGRRRRFGWLVLGAGLILPPTLLAESSNGVLYSLGRGEAWPAASALACVVLAYPSGRLSGRIDRVLAAAMGVAVAITMPTAL